MEFHIEEYAGYREGEILNLYASVGWIAYTRDPQTLRNAFENSLLTLAAYDGDRLIGILRAVGDGCTIVFVQDLLVHPDFQRKGVGSALLQSVMTRYAHVRQLQLTTDDSPESIAFYRSQGLRPLSESGCVAFGK